MLLEEHRLLERVLEELQRFVAEDVLAAGVDGRQRLTEFVRFLRSFDQLHHMKEEEILFGWMSQNGYSATEGPLAELLKEHTGFRHLLGRLDLSARADAPWDQAAREKVLTVANTYVAVLQGHLQDEEEVFDDLKHQQLPDATWRPVIKAFVDFDAQHDKRGLYQRAHGLQPGAAAAEKKGSTLPPPSASLPPSRSGGR
jgi:hemerythrin-like domain-containing protein